MKRNTLVLFLFIAALFLSVRLVYVYIDDVANFPINKVKVSADYKYISRDTIQSIITKYTGNSFFTFKSDALAKELKEIAWIASVTISRYWPDTVKVIVKEKKPIARIEPNGLITETGLVFFPPVDTIQLELPLLKGPKGRELVLLDMYKKANQILAQAQLTVTELVMTKSHAWTLTIQNGFKIKLGKVESIQRLQRFVKVYPEVVDDKVNKLVSVDLRYPQGIAIKWK